MFFWNWLGGNSKLLQARISGVKEKSLMGRNLREPDIEGFFDVGVFGTSEPGMERIVNGRVGPHLREVLLVVTPIQNSELTLGTGCTRETYVPQRTMLFHVFDDNLVCVLGEYIRPQLFRELLEMLVGTWLRGFPAPPL